MRGDGQRGKVTGSRSAGGTALTYRVTAAPDNALLIVTWYDGSGRMLGMRSADVAEGNTTNAKLIGVSSGAEICKLMLVDKTSFVPLCAAAIADRE